MGKSLEYDFEFGSFKVQPLGYASYTYGTPMRGGTLAYDTTGAFTLQASSAGRAIQIAVNPLDGSWSGAVGVGADYQIGKNSSFNAFGGFGLSDNGLIVTFDVNLQLNPRAPLDEPLAWNPSSCPASALMRQTG